MDKPLEDLFGRVKDAAARLRGVAHVTPVMTSRTLNERLGAEVFFKCENFQRIGAFKFRGAYNAMARLSADERRRGVITFSSGNHAQAVALVGKLLGIAARVVKGKGRSGATDEASDGLIVGTPGYISPEAARGETPMPAMDVFSAGVMLGELLSGAPLMRESNPYRAITRVQAEDLLLPAQLKIDDTLRGIVQRALARDSRQRYDGARAMHAALAAWMNPDEAPAQDDTGHATLDFLLRRMRHKTDFPALSNSVVRIQRVAMSETESLNSLSEEILKDVALTNKLLRMVNTVHFTSVAGGGVSTVSRAVAMVGFAGIRNMALSVVLLEHMGDKGHAAQLKEEFLRALMAGTLAAEMMGASRDGEEAFLAAMFQNLGRMLTEYYLQEEALQIRQAVALGRDTPQAREAAARKVLGIGFDELGAGVARAWGLPDTLQRSLRAPLGDLPKRVLDRRADHGVERMRWLARGANALADAMLGSDGEVQQAALKDVAERYAPALGLQPKDILASVGVARTQMTAQAQAMGLNVPVGAPARRLLQSTAAPAAQADAVPGALAAGPVATLTGGQPGLECLGNGLDAVRQAVAQRTMRLNEVLNLVLETLQQALELRCVVFCLRDPKSGLLLGRVALGLGSSEICSAFRIAPDPTAGHDLFAAISAKGADLLISDARSVVKRLPTWYRQRVNAGTFVLLPMVVKGRPIGLIYGDKAEASTLKVGEAELRLLRGLRDQAVEAFSKGSS
jgi:HD-like signal output (HDOD) protein